jgi:hypothetical protein
LSPLAPSQYSSHHDSGSEYPENKNVRNAELEDLLAGGNLGNELLESLTESLTGGGVLGDAGASVDATVP